MSQELQYNLMQRLKKKTLPVKALLSRFYFPNDELRKRPEYQDNAWMPFWYYLGLEERPKRLLDMGSELGLETACCIIGSKPPLLVSIQELRSRFTVKNIKMTGADMEFDCGFGWDLAIVHGDFSDHLDSIWDSMKLGGLICMTDNKKTLSSFAEIKNRVPTFCKLRYSIGLLRK
jgi:hypothetical protein